MLEINNSISVSIVDVIGSYSDGVSLLLSVMINNDVYEIAYWFNKNGDIRLSPEQKLLDILNVDSIYEYELLNELVYFIHDGIPNMDKIKKQYLDN